ncbi:MAG: ThiF family adenylyltransferase [Candidatus Saccharibacteria bacterium]|nr:ThiF family adenylyltransferase [Candidatus Saccharibacteria bacterium]
MRDFSDQTKFFDPDSFAWDVHIIGAGGIGNMVVMLLAKMGVQKIHLWDDDNFELRNGPTEVAYSEKFVGKPKVDVAEKTIEFLVGDHCEIIKHYERVTKKTKLSGIVISGVDSMASRQVIWQAIKECFLDVALYIDARSAGEEIAIFNVLPSDFEACEIYEKDWLFDDSEASQLACGARNIGYISTLIASIVAANLTKFEQGEELKFFQSLDASNLHTMF